MIQQPKLTAAAVTFVAGKEVSVLTLHVDPRDVENIARGCEVLTDLGCHAEIAKRLQEESAKASPIAPLPPISAAAEQDGDAKKPRDVPEGHVVVTDETGRPVAIHV